VAGTFETPIYSNAAYGLLGLALEKITGQTFDEVFEETISKPLGLKRTFWAFPGNDSNAVIPGDESSTWWDYDLAQDRS
jgi:CubicO group peptidase (beta-lactamase class C family)